MKESGIGSFIEKGRKNEETGKLNLPVLGIKADEIEEEED